ncbi:MAG: T9SS type A sorting domain-containing protein [Ignavibacteria bacterium]|nr:T9SS type A sorting domain-containing protein [Ignavibacteria bacterium]
MINFTSLWQFLSKKVILVALCVSSILASGSVYGQDYGKIDTLRYWPNHRSVSYLQAFGDTVIAKIDVIDDSSDSPHFEISYDRGGTWQYAMNKERQIRYFPGNGSYVVGYDQINEGLPYPRQFFWVYRKGEIVFEDTIAYGHPKYPLAIDGMYVHPIKPNLIFYKGLINAVGGKINVMFVSTNDGRDWRELKIPPPSLGVGWKITPRFDYYDPNVWYFAVNGRDVFGAPNRDEWYRTSDSGITFTSVERVNVLNGLWGEETTVSFPYAKQKPWHKKWSFGDPLLWNRSTQTTDTIPWIAHIQSCLFAGIDTTKAVLYLESAITNDEANCSLGFNPVLPGVFVVQIEIDSLIGAQIVHWHGVIVTVDTGKTWKWILPLHKYLNIAAYSIDALTGTIYVSYQASNVNPDDRTIAIVRCSPWTVSVNNNAPKAEDKFHCWPNPATDIVHIQSSREYLHGCSVQIFDMLGIAVDELIQSKVEIMDDNINIDVRDLPSGNYFLILTQNDIVQTVQVLILH